MNDSSQRNEKRPRIKPVPKRTIVFSTDKLKSNDIVSFFTKNILKKEMTFSQ